MILAFFLVECEDTGVCSYNIVFHLIPNIIYKVIPALIDRTRTTDIQYKLFIVLINKVNT